MDRDVSLALLERIRAAEVLGCPPGGSMWVSKDEVHRLIVECEALGAPAFGGPFGYEGLFFCGVLLKVNGITEGDF